MDQESFYQSAWIALTPAIRWELLCEANSGSQALFFIEQIDKDSYKLKVIPVKRQRTLSQERSSWNWNLPVRASSLCCASPNTELVCLISCLGWGEQCDGKDVLQLSSISLVIWQQTLPVSPKNRDSTRAKLRKAKIPLKSLVSKQCRFTAVTRTAATILNSMNFQNINIKFSCSLLEIKCMADPSSLHRGEGMGRGGVGFQLQANTV